MNIQDILQSGALDGMARELGVPRQTAATGAAALLPAILGGFKRQAQASPEGLDGLGGMLGQLGGGGLFDAVASPDPTPVSQGNDVLGQIFGSKDVSRQVAGHAAQSTGLDQGLLQRMLPMIAMAAAGYMAKKAFDGQGGAGGMGNMGGLGGAMAGGAGGGLGGMLGQVLGGAMGGGSGLGGAASGGGMGGMGGMGGALGGLGSLLDFDRDGNPLADIIGMAGRMRR